MSSLILQCILDPSIQCFSDVRVRHVAEKVQLHTSAPNMLPHRMGFNFMWIKVLYSCGAEIPPYRRRAPGSHLGIAEDCLLYLGLQEVNDFS